MSKNNLLIFPSPVESLDFLPLACIVPVETHIDRDDFLQPRGQELRRIDYPDLFETMLYNEVSMDYIIDKNRFKLPVYEDTDKLFYYMRVKPSQA